MRRVILAVMAAAVVTTGCGGDRFAPPGVDAQADTGSLGAWRLVDGPGGMRCVVYTAGAGNTSVLGLDCDWSTYR